MWVAMSENIVHSQEKYGLFPGAEEIPLMTVCRFSYVCNAKCSGCPFTISNTRNLYKETPFMLPEVFKKVADEVGAYGNFIRITGGGEPLLHPQAIELFLYAKAKNCRLGIISNGSQYDKNKLTSLLKANVDTLEISVDAGNEKDYNYARAGLNWEKLNKNVQMAIELREKLNSQTRIWVSIIEQKGIDIEAAIRHWEPLVDKVQLRKFLNFTVDNRKKSASTGAFLPLNERIPCPQLFDRTCIAPDGKVVLCGRDPSGEYSPGSILKQSLSEIWTGPFYSSVRELHLSKQREKFPMCNGCTDVSFKSWSYNFWKILKDTEK